MIILASSWWLLPLNRHCAKYFIMCIISSNLPSAPVCAVTCKACFTNKEIESQESQGNLPEVFTVRASKKEQILIVYAYVVDSLCK